MLRIMKVFDLSKSGSVCRPATIFQFILLAAVSCTAIPEEKITESVKADCVLTAVAEEPDTKVALGSGNIVKWQEGDAISLISDTDVNDRFVLSGGEGTASGTFSGELSNPALSHIGIYPYNAANICGTGNGVAFWGSEDDGTYIQTATKDGFDPLACIMAGTLHSSNNIAFKNLCSYFKLTVDFPCTSIAITNNASSPLASKSVMFTLDEDGLPVTISSGDLMPDSYSVTLVGKNGAEIAPGTYLIAALPQTLSSGFTVSMTSAVNGETYTKRAEKPAKLKRSGILNLGEFSIKFFTGKEFEGSGTKADPYKITTLDDLLRLAELVNGDQHDTYCGKVYAQTRDIDCQGKTIQIGYHANQDEIHPVAARPFTGIYDGNSHTISNFIPGCEYGWTGLFGQLTSAEISNLTLTPVSVSVNVRWGDNYCGVLAGFAEYESGKFVTVSNCHLKTEGQTFLIDHWWNTAMVVGGLIGSSTANLKISRCTNDTGFKSVYKDSPTKSAMTRTPVGPYYGADASMGGIVGEAYAPNEIEVYIDRCRNSGTLFLENPYFANTGGIVGLVKETDNDLILYVTNSENTAYITAGATMEEGRAHAGGIVGRLYADGTAFTDPKIANCFNSGQIMSSGQPGCAGGIMGYCLDTDTDVYCCVNTGVVCGTNLGYDDPRTWCEDMFGAICGAEGGSFHYCKWNRPSWLTVRYGCDEDYGNGCGYQATITAAEMNSLLSKNPSIDGVTYHSWTGTSDDDSLSLGI